MLLAVHTPQDAALTSGFHRALLACAIFLLGAAVIALLAANSRGKAATPPVTQRVHDQISRPDLAD